MKSREIMMEHSATRRNEIKERKSRETRRFFFTENIQDEAFPRPVKEMRIFYARRNE